MHALTAAALTYSIARACAQGKMAKCQCATERHSDKTKLDWRWGGCSDNSKHGKRSVRKFLQLQRSDGDQVSDILRHNSEVNFNIIHYYVFKFTLLYKRSHSGWHRSCYVQCSRKMQVSWCVWFMFDENMLAQVGFV